MNEVKSCPFCGGSKQTVREQTIPYTGCVYTNVSIQCTCSAEGPGGKSVNEAVTKWNHRVLDKRWHNLVRLCIQLRDEERREADSFTYDYDKDEMIKAICDEVNRLGSQHEE